MDRSDVSSLNLSPSRVLGVWVTCPGTTSPDPLPLSLSPFGARDQHHPHRMSTGLALPLRERESEPAW